MYYHFFEGQHPPTIITFDFTRLRVHDYILFRVIIPCILPINIRNLAIMRHFHLFMLYALHQRVDMNINLHIFYSIIYHSEIITNGRIHMLYCHVITLLLPIRVDVSLANIKLLFDFDKIGFR